jgi:hypothetical protein
MKKILYELAILLSPLVVILLLVFSLNYSGFCFKEFRYLSDREQMESLFNIWNRSSISKTVLIDGEYQVLKRKNRYANFDEFLEKYPNCCEIDPEGGYDTAPPNFIDRITGYDSGTRILLEFNEEYRYPDGDILTEEIQIVDRLQNCGESRW